MADSKDERLGIPAGEWALFYAVFGALYGGSAPLLFPASASAVGCGLDRFLRPAGQQCPFLGQGFDALTSPRAVTNSVGGLVDAIFKFIALVGSRIATLVVGTFWGLLTTAGVISWLVNIIMSGLIVLLLVGVLRIMSGSAKSRSDAESSLLGALLGWPLKVAVWAARTLFAFLWNIFAAVIALVLSLVFFYFLMLWHSAFVLTGSIRPGEATKEYAKGIQKVAEDFLNRLLKAVHIQAASQ